ncbi:MAG: DUF4765 family protein [Nanoarchaeota archaeon]|nr:DUF4765 family protein [Nanoarchaeota archaeon]MBU4124275.1 DUF4765 family protein [Nanoarchaeota archaeon]
MNINPDSFIHDTLEFVSKLIHDNIHDPEVPTQKIRVVPSFPTEVKIPLVFCREHCMILVKVQVL